MSSDLWNGLGFFAQQPSSIESGSEAFFYYRKMLLRKVMNIFQLDNAPKEWNIDYLWINLISGSQQIVIADTPIGVIPIVSGVTGNNVYGMPTEALIVNHVFTGELRKSLDECVLLYLNYDYLSRCFYKVDAMINKYAVMLANCDSAINVNILNSKSVFIFDCEDKLQAQDAKDFYSVIAKGEPAVFRRANSGNLNSDGKVGITQLNCKNAYVADLVQDTKRSIMSEFWTELGVDNSPVDKKERVNIAEAESNYQQLQCSVADWNRNLTEQFRRVNELFGLDVRFSMPFLAQQKESSEGGEDDAGSKSSDNDAD